MIRRVAAIAVVAALAVAGVFLTGASDESGAKRTYFVEFDNAFGLVEGGDLKVGGVRAGQTKDFRLSTEGERATALVEVEVSEPGFTDFRSDASCAIRPQSLIGEYFVDCQPGTAGESLPEGGVVPKEQNTGFVNQDLVNNIMRRPYRERFRLILSELGSGLAGRPQDLQEVLKRAHPGLRETSEALRILASQNRTIREFIENSDTVVDDLEDRKEDVARWVREAGETAEISASRRESIAQQFRRFPTFLDELEPTMERLGELADEQVPTLRDLRRAAPELTEFFEELGPFADASLPSIRSLGRAARTGRAALDESGDEIEELKQLATKAPRFGKPLRQFLQTIDDRERYWEVDPRAAQTDPPAPDPTAGAEGKGFTGMEAILNYVYWQTLAVNQYDEIGHVLRIVAFESECGIYHTGDGIRYDDPEKDEETQHLFDRCQSWTGPYQPGITAPDPTDDSGRQVAAREKAERERVRETGTVDRPERGAGEPEAPPVPGQRDPSQPQIVLPPGVQELIDQLPGLDNLGGGDLPGVGNRRSPGGDEQLLDFLLAP
ncbi:MAG TPA: MlaD family protein [Thermoleophilaceae bacterium]|nr:MlaD family protein [Thermoleophilaceae bacterium]